MKTIAAFAIVSALMLFILCDACPEKCTCTNHNIICEHSTIKSLPRWRNSTVRLFMEGDILFQLNSSVINQSCLSNLRTLKLVYMNIQAIHAHTFYGMRKLESLTIRNNNLTDLQPGAFLGLDRLHTLDISDNELKNISTGVFQGLTALRHLNLTINRLRHFHNGMFDGLRRGGSCELANARSVLILDRNYNGTFDEDAFRGLNFFTQLTMSFEYNPWISFPTTFEGLCGLQKLVISDTQLFSGVENKTSMRGLINLSYLEISFAPLKLVKNRFLADSSLLRKLKIVFSFIQELEPGCFYGLRSLSDLDLTGNELIHLNKGVFDDLKSLKRLSIRFNYLTTIEENTFKGLSNLRFLLLGNNKLWELERNAFSELVSLRQLTLSNEYPNSQIILTNMGAIYLHNKNRMRKTHPEAFSGLSMLKIIEQSYVPTNAYNNVSLDSLQRLDGFSGPAYFKSNSLKTMTTLLLIGWNSLISNDIYEWLSQISYIKDPIFLEIYYLNSLKDLNPLSKFDIHTLYLISSNISTFENNDFREVYKLNSLIITNNLALVIKQGAFRNLYNLHYLKLYTSGELVLEPGVFQELSNLEELVLGKGEQFEITLKSNLFKGLTNVKVLTLQNNKIKNIDFDSFADLENLQILDLSRNYISSLNQGVFRELRNIQRLNLRVNRITYIDAGVFGALCPDNFTLTCSNLTRLSAYCDTSFALPTLSSLDLSYNNITFINQQGFLGCNKLEILILSETKIHILDFLFTPHLKDLWYEVGNLSIISNTTFKCTRMLSRIFFQYTELRELHSSAFENLQNLKVLELPRIKCDCKLRRIWQWLRSHRVEYKLCNDYHCLSCNGELIDSHLSKLECNSSDGNGANRPSNKTSGSNDYAQFKMYIEPIVFIFIFLTGCFGNGLLLFLVLSHSDLRNKNNACVVHLAFADILSLVLNLPLSYWDVVHVTWDLDETTCKVFIMSKDLVVGLVVFTVLALTFERFLVVRSSFKLKSSCGFNSRPAVFLGIVWIQALISSMPSYFNATVQIRCFSSPPGRGIFVQRTWTFQLLMYCIVPISSIVFLNIITAYVLKESIKKFPGEIRNEARERMRNTVANVVSILSVVFTLSYLPNFLLRALVSWTIIDIEDVFWYSFATYCLFFLHTIFNPFALFVMSSKYKSYLMRYISFFLKENSRHSEMEGKVGNIFYKLGKSHGGTGHQVPTDEIAAEDQAVREARQERLKKLQARFM